MSDTEFRIDSNDLSISQIYKDFYSVPDFQREYVWEESHVEKLLQDIYNEFYDEAGREIKGPEYFLGTIVVCRDSTGIYELIDGQQRMTTIYLVLCAARDCLKETRGGLSQSRNLTDLITYSYTNPKRDYAEEARHRLTLQYSDSDDILEKMAKAETPVDEIIQRTDSVKKIVAAYKAIREFFSVEFKNNPDSVRLFTGIFSHRIKLIRIETPTINNALKVFETINDRGVGLNAMDLLKNLLFMKTPGDQYPRLKEKWKVLTDTLSNCREKPLRFLRYYILSYHKIDYNKIIREDDIYDWFTSHAEVCGIGSNPLGFADILIECAQAHANFLQGMDVMGNKNRYLYNISMLGGTIKQHHILLLAGMHLPEVLFNTLCQSIENLFFCYIITREPTKLFERNFARWSQELREVETQEQLDVFLHQNFIQDMARRSDRFDFALRDLRLDNIQKYRIKYILARISQYIEEMAWGNEARHDLSQYTDTSVHIEHILPDNPQPATRQAFDQPELYDDYKQKLGNLTLLENTINGSKSNKPFSDCKQDYLQSCFLLTRAIAERPSVGKDTQLNRAVAELESFDEWTSESITMRQEMLTNLARKVWGMTNMSEEHLETVHATG